MLQGRVADLIENAQTNSRFENSLIDLFKYCVGEIEKELYS